MIRYSFLILLLVFPFSALAQSETETFPELAEIIADTAYRDPIKENIEDLFETNEIRLEAIAEAALSYGARAGLAKRTSEIKENITNRSGSLDSIYDFKRLLIPAPSGLLIEPPIISEGENATLIETGGQTAAVADRIFNINRSARIVSSPRNWRAYLERDWGEISQPPQLLFPQNDAERRVWIENLTIGWDKGIEQADEIFQADLDKLVADFTGMVRYRRLLAQGIVSAPFALQVDRGVTGGGDEMRVGDRAVQITGPSQLMTEAFEWQPVSR